MNAEIEAYKTERAKVLADFIAKAKADAAAIRANPSEFTLSDALAVLGLDEALTLHQAGALKAA